MKKTEEREFLCEKLHNWAVNHKKKIWLSTYVIFIIAFAIIIIIGNGGIQATVHSLNDYPEEKYQELEQELQNIVVERDGIYPEELSNDSIKYEIVYKETSNSEGKYTITLTDGATVTGTIGKDLKKEDLIIEREYKTKRAYRADMYSILFFGLLTIPVIPTIFLFLIINLFCGIILSIEYLFRWYLKKKDKK